MYATLSLLDSVIILGGFADDLYYYSPDKYPHISPEGISSKIAKYDGKKWSDLGNLRSARYMHSVIDFHGNVMIIGGRTNGHFLNDHENDK